MNITAIAPRGAPSESEPKRLPRSGQIPAHIWASPGKKFSRKMLALVEWDAAAFQAFCRGLYPANTESHVAADTGQSASTVRKHMTPGSARPGADILLVYLACYGPALLACLLPVCHWAERAADEEERAQLRRTLEAIGDRL